MVLREDNMIGIALWENTQGRTGLTGDGCATV